MGSEAPLLQLDGFEGPLDLLLDLARAQKVDLAKISVLALVEQFLAVIEGARVRLELAADWLVMAAWLTWLKSRLLLPEAAAEPEAEQGALSLAARLAELAAARLAAGWMAGRSQLGWDEFARATPEDFTEIDRSRLRLEPGGLLAAYLSARRRAAGRLRYRPKPLPVYSVQDAVARLRRLLGSLPDWSALEAFLPEDAATGPRRRAALSASLLASLEMARGGAISLRQERDFAPILLRARPEAGP